MTGTSSSVVIQKNPVQQSVPVVQHQVGDGSQEHEDTYDQLEQPVGTGGVQSQRTSGGSNSSGGGGGAILIPKMRLTKMEVSDREFGCIGNELVKKKLIFSIDGVKT